MFDQATLITNRGTEWFDNEIALLERTVREMQRHRASYLEARKQEAAGEEQFSRAEQHIGWAVNTLKTPLFNSRIDMIGEIFASHMLARK